MMKRVYYRMLKLCTGSVLADRLSRYVINRSAYFDPDWYCARKSGDIRAGDDVALHYLRTGSSEGTNPGPLFDAKWYTESYLRHQTRHIDPLVHFELVGKQRGHVPRNPVNPHSSDQGPQAFLSVSAADRRRLGKSDLFDEDYYFRELKEHGLEASDALEHYLRIGAGMGLDPGPGFSTTWYLDQYADVREIGINPLLHYMKFGRFEGRQPGEKTLLPSPFLPVSALDRRRIRKSDLFDENYYIQVMKSLGMEASDALDHYLQTGAGMGLDPGRVFSTSWYLNMYDDVREAGYNPLWHYVKFGRFEGRQPGETTVLPSLTKKSMAKQIIAPLLSAERQHWMSKKIARYAPHWLWNLLFRRKEKPATSFFASDNLSRFNRPKRRHEIDQKRILRMLSEDHMPEAMAKVDVSAVTFNSGRWLDGFFASLLRQDYRLDRLRLLFTDNGSDDDSVEKIKQFSEWYGHLFEEIVISQRPNDGFGAGHNWNLRYAGGEFFLVTNVDLEFEASTLTILVGAAQSSEEKTAAWECRQKPYEHPKYYNPVNLETSCVSCACCLFRTSLMVETGGFDTRLFMYGEDMELSFRLRDRGFVLRYVPSAVVWHYTYDNPTLVKSLLFAGSVVGNLYVRLKYGTAVDFIAGMGNWCLLFLRNSVVRNHRRILLSKLGELFRLLPAALDNRKLSDRRFTFNRWTYETNRPGESYEFEPLPEDKPKVSIIIRTYKGREQWLMQALASAANQTWPNAEIVIVEDGSTTNEQLVASLAPALRQRVVYRPLPKVGKATAANKAMEIASGQYMMFLDDDDLLFADHVEVLMQSLRQNPGHLVAYTLAWEARTEVVQHQPLSYIEHEYQVPVSHTYDFSRQRLSMHNYMPIQAPLFHRILFEQCGGMDPRLKHLDDWNLWQKFAERTEFVLVKRVTSLYRIPPARINRQRLERMQEYYNMARIEYDETAFRDTLTETLPALNPGSPATGEVIQSLPR